MIFSREPNSREKVEFQTTHFSAKRFWMSFSAAAKNSSSSDSDGIFSAMAVDLRSEFTTVGFAVDSTPSDSSSRRLLEGVISLLRENINVHMRERESENPKKEKKKCLNSTKNMSELFKRTLKVREIEIERKKLYMCTVYDTMTI